MCSPCLGTLSASASIHPLWIIEQRNGLVTCVGGSSNRVEIFSTSHYFLSISTIMAGCSFASDGSTTLAWEEFSHLATRCVRSSSVSYVRDCDLLKLNLSWLRLQLQVKHENPVTRSLL